MSSEQQLYQKYIGQFVGGVWVPVVRKPAKAGERNGSERVK